MTDTPTPEREPLDDWMTPEHKAAALEGFLANSVAVAYAAARAERTPEPATAEDVETVARAQYEADHDADLDAADWDHVHYDMAVAYREAAQVALAALDLPGREKALREEIELKGWDLVAAGQANERLRELLAEAEAERDEARDELTRERDLCDANAAEVERLGELLHRAEAEREYHKERADKGDAEAWRLQHQLDLADAAMPEDVDPENDLATQIRTLVATIAETRSVAAEDIARAIEADADDRTLHPNRDETSFTVERWLRAAAQVARDHATADTTPAADGGA